MKQIQFTKICGGAKSQQIAEDETSVFTLSNPICSHIICQLVWHKLHACRMPQLRVDLFASHISGAEETSLVAQGRTPEVKEESALGIKKPANLQNLEL